MPEFKSITREEAEKFPKFNNHKEAGEFLKETYGDDISLVYIDDNEIYLYEYITNRGIYEEMKIFIQDGYWNESYNGNDPRTKYFSRCRQTVRVWDDGRIVVTY